ncbi:MAG TPA: S1/P1 nuclease [Pyrinomonadaceae bacterium]|nr:S1/P1 nuclease [Pyrinomonadaceae bacterium]
MCILLSAPTSTFGWGAGGHMMIAYIAYKRLNPKARNKVSELLAINIAPSSVTSKSKDFVNASHWADDLRPFPEFDEFKVRHFIDKPILTDGTPPPPEDSDNIVKALEDNLQILQTSTDKNAQARALRFIIHFVGDIHQPLHCSTKVDQAHPEGDRGGNLFSLSIPDKGGKKRLTNLHSYWDGGLGSFPPTGANFAPPSLSTIPAAATLAMKANPATDPRLKLDGPFIFRDWADESFVLARDSAYQGIQPKGFVSASYTAKNLKVVRTRVAWAGYRLSALLNAIWPD